MIRRKLYLTTVVLVALAVVAAQPAAAASVSWGTSSDWDNATSESDVVHESTANTDYDDGGEVRLGPATSNRVGESSLVAHWLFQEDSGSTAYDFAGSNDASVSGADPAGSNGLLGTTSWSFDGSSDNYASSSVGTSPIDGDYTVSFWMKSSSGSTMRAFRQDSTSSGPHTVLILNGDELQFYEGSETSDLSIVNSSITDGNWHHVSVVSDPANNERRLYLDGRLEASGSDTSGSSGSDSDFWIGSDTGGSADNLDGSLADFRFYGTALSDPEISEIYEIGSGHIKTSSKTFGGAVKPSLSATANPNGQDISVTVTGSPGTADEETNTVSLNGSGSYNTGWSTAHTDFVANASLSTTDVSQTPSLQDLTLTGTPVTDAYNVSGTVTDSSGNSLDDLTVDAVNSSSGTVDASTVTSSSGGYELSVTNGSYNIRAYGSGYSADTQTITVDGADISGVDLTPTTDAPALDDSSASPDDTFVGTDMTTLSIDVSDAQFGSLGGEEVTVEFFNGADNSLGTDTLTSPGTASVSANTPSEWYVVATDATGLQDTSATFQITAPPDIMIYNEPSDSLVSTDVTLDIESLDSSYSTTQTIQGGSGTLQAPGGERLHITATASGYVDRDFLLSNYTRDYPIVMLPTTDSDSVRYEQCFDLVDNTGKFDAANSYAIIQTEVNSSQTQYKGMVSSGFFGSNNLHCAFLVDQKPYTLSVQNTNGDMHRFGEWISQDNGQTYTLQIGDLEVISSDSDADEEGRFFAVAEQTDASPPRLKTEYFDRSASTSELYWEIYTVNESGSDTLLKSSNASGRFGQFSDSYVLNDSLTGSTFRVEWTAYDNGTSVASGSETTGSLEDIDLPISDKWLQILSVIFIVAMGGLLVPSQPRLAAVVMALSATMLTMVGWIAIPTWALAPAVSAALLYQVAGVSGRI